MNLRTYPRLTMLNRENCLRLHQASCHILKNTGVKVHSETGLDLLRRAGAVITDNLVKIPPSLVEHALATAPGSFNLYRRGTTEVAIKLDGEAAYFGPGSDTLHYLDPRTGQRRDFQVADIADCARLCDALPEINFVMSVGIPRDVPGERHYRHQFAAMLRHATKPIVFVCDNLADIEAIAAMAAAAAGGMAQFSQYPTLLLYAEPSTPLQHSRTAAEKLLFCAEYRIPVTHSPAPMMGGTAPVTLAGAVALGNAEMLSGLVMHQLKNPGAPFLYGHGVHHMDMKEMVSVYGAPEFQLARVMAAEMGRFYGLPVWGYAGHSDSKVVDAQAAADAQFAVLVALLAKTNLNHDVGYLESGLTGSPEMMVLTNEIISMTRSFAAGVSLDDEALAVEVINEVGPGGQFINHDHTFAHWRELWLPQLFNRQRLDAWEKQGANDINVALRDKTIALMDEHCPDALPASVESEIEAILKL
ncbi:MAG: trimethylamine methyltransferase family protein [Anaerolineae bacterium]|nr:trimethylamine methyltransferase family protein [Anaerolineae bacterium]